MAKYSIVTPRSVLNNKVEYIVERNATTNAINNVWSINYVTSHIKIMIDKPKTIQISPKKGIGDIELGMDKMDVHNKFGDPFVAKENNNYLREAYLDTGIFLEYRNYKVSNIELTNSLTSEYRILLYDIDVFQMKASDLIHKLKEQHSFSFDRDSIKDSTIFICKELGMNFWRPTEDDEHFESISIY